jgi:uncharacterized membrane protein YphA (DoxX/SURF4 family)
LALLLLASPFLISGLAKIADFAGATAEVRALTGVEPASVVALAVIATQLVGSVLLLLSGRWTRIGAAILAAFVVAATLLAHAWWTKEGADRVRDFNVFWEHVAIVGGLAAAALASGWDRRRGDGVRAPLMVAALMFWSADAEAACPSPPAFENLRYDEDHSYLRDPSCGRSSLDRLKHIELGTGYLSLGGEARIRGEFARRPDFGLRIREDQAVLSRTLMHADVHAIPGVRAFVQLGAYFATGREEGDGPIDEDRLDLAQAFLDISVAAGPGRATLRGGRQEAAFGSARLVSTRENPNVRRSFDGGRVFWEGGDTRVAAFYLRPVEPERGVFDNRSDSREELYGLYATGSLAPGLYTDIYYIGFGRANAAFAQGVAFEDRHSLGVRLFGARRGTDWDIEAVYQFGSFGPADISAWTVAADVGYTFSDIAWQPRLGLKTDIASGDQDPGDRRLGTFNALYPKLPYFTEAGLIAPANIIDLHPTLGLAPRADLTVAFGVNMLWRHRRGDAFYAPPLKPVAIAGGRYVATQGEVAAEWQVSRHVELKAWYVHAFAGEALKAAGGGNVSFAAASIAWKF